MKVFQYYRFALEPNNVQAAAIARHAGAARFAYNWGLSRVKAAIDQREAEKTYSIPDDELTEVPWSLYSLRKDWNRAKHTAAPWWAECSKEAYSAGLDRLARGLRNYTDSRKGKRKGRRIGFPRFKKRGRSRESFRYTTDHGIADDRHVKLPKIGRVKTCEKMTALTTRVADGTARLLGVTVSRTAGRWFASFTVEADREMPTEPTQRQRRNETVGVDLGVSSLAVLSTGEKVANPRHYKRSLRKLRTASRAYARTRPGSNRRAERSARLARIHARVANQRRDGLHKLSNRLTKDHGTVVIEDLGVARMVKNRKLARSIHDVGMAEFRRQLGYKTMWYGSRLHVADRWYPSSKTCSGCGWRNPSLPLSVRTFVCESCGIVIDRDENAAVNLKQLVAGSGPETVNGRGADRETRLGEQVAVKRQPGTAAAGQTGTAPRQREAARHDHELTHASRLATAPTRTIPRRRT